MIVLGDVFAVIATLLASFLTSYAMILGLSLLYPSRSRAAANYLATNSAQGFWRGLLMGGGALFGLVVLSQVPVPLAKLASLLGFCLLICVAMVGASGITQNMANRLRTMDPGLSPHAALSKSTMLLVGAGLFPVVGWFLFAPAILFVSLGGGIAAWRRDAATVEAA
ncbi:MAG: hypothetical protein JNJ45_12370 [Chthonomonas sp.]|nr:hypothetical protein [Chthonomonas sp.]